MLVQYPNTEIHLKSDPRKKTGKPPALYICRLRNLTFHEIGLAFVYNRYVPTKVEELLYICNVMRLSGQSQCWKSPYDKLKKDTKTLKDALPAAAQKGWVVLLPNNEWCLTQKGIDEMHRILSY